MSGIDLSVIENYSVIEIVIMLVVGVFIISAIVGLMKSWWKWILIFVFVNLAIWYFVFGIKVTSIDEFFSCLIIAWRTTFYVLLQAVQGALSSST